ncbi:MAG TPA: response regulator transcription factor [Methyloceanibacter sp.]|nr:response regulator transcription factor [Methyloceanibacter sp.]
MLGEQASTSTELNSQRVKRGQTGDKRDIFYLDARALTRDCIAHELARQLPDFNIVEHALLQDLVAVEVSRLHTAAAAILHVHAEPFAPLADGQTEMRSIATGFSALEQIAPDVPRILLSEVESPERILEAFNHRVRGYVPTTLPIDQVAEAIRFGAAGGTFVPHSILSLHTRFNQPPPEVAASPDLSAGITQFSPRQIEVLRMLWRGSSNKLIAYELNMCESTVKVHIRHIMKRLNAKNRTQIVLKTRPPTLGNNGAVGLANFAVSST